MMACVFENEPDANVDSKTRNENGKRTDHSGKTYGPTTDNSEHYINIS